MAVRHREVADGLRDEITRSVYAVGTCLPSEADIAARYGVSRGTVRHALAALALEGLLGSRQGARRVVLRREAAQSFSDLRSFAQWAERNGHRPGGQAVASEERGASADEADRLQLEVGDRVLRVTRLRTLDGQAAMVERTVYAGWVADIVASIPADCPSVTAWLGEHGGITFARGEHLIDAVGAGQEDAELLGVRRASPLLRHRHVTSTAKGQPIETSEDRYRSGITAFSVYNSIDANALRRAPSGLAGWP